MRRLFWKEWQERRLWIALWVLTGVVTTVLGKGQRIADAYDVDPSWMMLAMATALLAGLGGYGSELHGERATFLYSRAITWKQILAAKLLLGFFTVIGSVIINAISGSLSFPAEYHHFVTPHSLVMGALMMAGFTGASYLIGLACSTVLPGLAGSILVLIGWVMLGSSVYNFASREAMIGPILLLLAPLVAGFVLSRFGISLHLRTRLWRFSLIVSFFIVLGILLDLTPPSRALYVRMNMPLTTWPERYSTVKFNPDATYAYVSRFEKGQYISSLVRLSDRQIYNLPEQDSIIEYRWLDKSVLLIARSKHAAAEQPGMPSLTLWQWQDTTPRSCSLTNTGSFSMRYNALSPDSRRVLIGGYDELRLCDLRSGLTRSLVKVDKIRLRLLSRKEPGEMHGLFQCWWQTNVVVGYIEPFSGKRVLVSVP